MSGKSRSIPCEYENKLLNTALKENYYFLKSLVDALPNPVFYKDTTGNYQFCNDAFLDYVGLDRESVIGHGAYDIAPKELAEIYHRADEELMSSNGSLEYETNMLCADGNLRDVIFKKATVTNPAGLPMGIVGILQDITQRNLIEKQLVSLHKVKDVFIELNYEIVNFDNLSAFFPVMLIKLFLVFENCSKAAVFERKSDGQLEILCSIGFTEAEADAVAASAKNHCLSSTSARVRDNLCIEGDEGLYHPMPSSAIAAFNAPRSFSGILIPIAHEGQTRWTISLQSEKDAKFTPNDLPAAEYIQQEIPILIRMIGLYLDNLSYARYDYLTGVMSCGYFNNALEEELKAVPPQEGVLCVVSFDLNGLKHINDQFGHKSGDCYIQAFVRQLKENFRDSDLIGRLGGDEFACVLYEGSRQTALERLTIFQTAFAQSEINCEKGPFRGSFGFGAAVYGSDGSDKEELLQIADQRMYENKKQQKNRA